MRKALHPGAARFFHFQVLLLGLIIICLLAAILTSFLKDGRQDQKAKLFPVEVNCTSLKDKSFIANRDLVLTDHDPGSLYISACNDLPLQRIQTLLFISNCSLID